MAHTNHTGFAQRDRARGGILFLGSVLFGSLLGLRVLKLRGRFFGHVQIGICRVDVILFGKISLGFDSFSDFGLSDVCACLFRGLFRLGFAVQSRQDPGNCILTLSTLLIESFRLGSFRNRCGRLVVLIDCLVVEGHIAAPVFRNRGKNG